MIKNLDIIKDKVELFGIVGRYVLLKRSGSNFVGCCPFHDEKSASFVVSPRKNNYVCYGCGKCFYGGEFVSNAMLMCHDIHSNHRRFARNSDGYAAQAFGQTPKSCEC
jgi:hypothetical protein